MRCTYTMAFSAIFGAVGCSGNPIGSNSNNRPATTGTGGVAAAGSSTGGTCATAAKATDDNCGVASTGIGSLSISLYYDYIEAPFQGFAYVIISQTSNPRDTLVCHNNHVGTNGVVVVDSSWCGVGTVPSDCTGNAVGGIGFNLNQPQWGAGTLDDDQRGFNQPTSPIASPSTVNDVTVAFINRANSDLRIQIAQHSASGPIYYCWDIAGMSSPLTVEASRLTKTCWDSSDPGATWDGTGAESIALIIPSQKAKPTPFDACILGAEFH
jgi:hypothetical protein